jgi:hypothetical protein
LQAGKLLVNLGYFPSYSVLKRAMLSYGYLFDTPGTEASTSGSPAAGCFHRSFLPFLISCQPVTPFRNCHPQDVEGSKIFGSFLNKILCSSLHISN